MALKDLFIDIADAIRYMDGTSAKIVANDFPNKIKQIPRGDISIVPLSVTENGRYTPQTGEAFGQVDVNVSGGGGGGLISNKLNGQRIDPNGDILSYTYQFSDPTTRIHVTALHPENIEPATGQGAYIMGVNPENSIRSNYFPYTPGYICKKDTGTGYARPLVNQLSLSATAWPYYAQVIWNPDDPLIRFGAIKGPYDMGSGADVEFVVFAWNDSGSVDMDWFIVKSRDQSCVLKGTKIRLANGTDKNVEDITYDDELLVWNFDERKLDTAKPLWIKKPQKNPYYFVNKLKSGKVLLTTGQSKTGWGHRMFDMDKGLFRYTTETVCDMIYTLDGADMHISCERIEEECEYYNIITEKHMNLFANGILTSCSMNNLYPVQLMQFVKEDRKPQDLTGIEDKWIKGLRLNESTMSVESIKKYVQTLKENQQ